MEEITKWYADKIGKTPDEFDEIDKHIETVIQTWEKERALTIPSVSVSLFDEALKLMRDLAEHQNGAPLIRYEEEYNKTMTEVWSFLEANEKL